MLLAQTVSFIIVPLKRIGYEQVANISRLRGKPCFLEKDTINSTILWEIQHRKYTHIFLSPELAVGKKMRPVIIDLANQGCIAAVFIDEAHLVTHWGANFRKDYANLGLLRCLIGPNVPWGACSATLDHATLTQLIKGASFKADVKIQRSFIDRPELLFRVGIIPKNSRAKFNALRFLFGPTTDSDAIISSSNIPKTVIFFDSKKEVHAAHKAMIQYLMDHPCFQYSKQHCVSILKTYTRDTATKDQELTVAELQKPGCESCIRVIFATEALGMGVDLPDIRRCVLYGLPKNLLPAIYLQRGGRACRDGKEGEIILLVDQWTIGERPNIIRNQTSIGSDELDEPESNLTTEPESNPTTNTTNNKPLSKRALSEKERLLKLPQLWYDICNHIKCIRRMVLSYFEEPDEFWSVEPSRCCSHCNTHFQLHDLDHVRYYIYSERGPGYGKKQKAIYADLQAWVQLQLPRITTRFLFTPNASCFLEDSICILLARKAHETFTTSDLQQVLGPWRYWDTHGAQLHSILRDSWGKHQTAQRNITYSSQNSNNTPSQLQYTPVPGLSMTQNTIDDSEFEPSTPITPVPSQAGVKRRRALQPISENTRKLRPYIRIKPGLIDSNFLKKRGEQNHL